MCTNGAGGQQSRKKKERKWSTQDSNWYPYRMLALQVSVLPVMPQCQPLGILILKQLSMELIVFLNPQW